MASRGHSHGQGQGHVHVIDLMFDDNPQPTKTRFKASRTSAQSKEVQEQKEEHSAVRGSADGVERGAEVRVSTDGYEPPPTSKELMSYALHMNSHQIAKELLLDNEDINFIQETSSFLTGNTGLNNTGSIRRNLSERQLFLKAVEEVERARARIISQATKAQTPSRTPRTHSDANSTPRPILERAMSVESDQYSENYESDFSADSIDEDQKDDDANDAIIASHNNVNQRIISDLTEDYEDDYEDYEETTREEQTLSSPRNRISQSSHLDDKQSAIDSDEDSDNQKNNESKEDDVFNLFNDLADDSDSEQATEEDREHERSILKRLNDAHAQCSPSRLSRNPTPLSYFDSPSQRAHRRNVTDNSHPQPLEELAELDMEHEDTSVQYSQLMSKDSSYPFTEGSSRDGHRRKSFQAHKTDNSYLSKFSESTKSSCNSQESPSAGNITHSFDKSIAELNGDGSIDDEVALEGSINTNTRIIESDVAVRLDRERNEADLSAPPSLAATLAPGKLSELNNLNLLVSGGLNEWLVMNMKENTSEALRTMNKRVDHHHIRDNGDDISEPALKEGETSLSRDLQGRFSVCTEVYQHYLSEALELKTKYDSDVRVRSMAHEFTGGILNRAGQLPSSHDEDDVDLNAVSRTGSRGSQRRHSAKAKDDFDLSFLNEGGVRPVESGDDDNCNNEMLLSDSKHSRYHRKQAAGQKLTSASLQIECVSKLEGGRNSSSYGISSKDEDSREGRDDEDDSVQYDFKSGAKELDHDISADEAAARIELSRSFNLKKEEIRKRNRRAIFAAMHLGDIAGKLVMEKSRGASVL